MDLIDSSSSSSEDEDIAEVLNMVNGLNRRRPPRIEQFVEVTLANSSDREFQEHFRVNRPTFNSLLEKLRPALEKDEGVVGKPQIPATKQLLSVLWLLATPDSYRSVGNRFDLGKSSLFTCFHRVVLALNEISPDIIKWPRREDRVDIKGRFEEIAGLQGVVGAIDGTYIPIKAPQENPEVYVNRKCFHAITLQAICTYSLQFIDCFTGYPSSVSDARIFRNSDIYQSINRNVRNFFDDNEYILGDKAYPLFNWCIAPYTDRGNLTDQQRRFNTVHAQTRQVIERSFALLFGRFRRLRYLDMNRLDLIPPTVIACCVLHNICLANGDDLLEDYVNEGLQEVQDQNEREQMHPEAQQVGNIIRDNLAADL